MSNSKVVSNESILAKLKADAIAAVDLAHKGDVKGMRAFSEILAAGEFVTLCEIYTDATAKDKVLTEKLDAQRKDGESKQYGSGKRSITSTYSNRANKDTGTFTKPIGEVDKEGNPKVKPLNLSFKKATKDGQPPKEPDNMLECLGNDEKTWLFVVDKPAKVETRSLRDIIEEAIMAADMPVTEAQEEIAAGVEAALSIGVEFVALKAMQTMKPQQAKAKAKAA